MYDNPYPALVYVAPGSELPAVCYSLLMQHSPPQTAYRVKETSLFKLHVNIYTVY